MRETATKLCEGEENPCQTLKKYTSACFRPTPETTKIARFQGLNDVYKLFRAPISVTEGGF